MKKIFFYWVIVFFFLSLSSQTIVSTSPQNKNAILEEFTGMYCSVCPTGHRISDEIKNANPGRVWVINIHQGPFANPGPGEPDLRTPFGDSLAMLAGVQGYPDGMINRHEFLSGTILVPYTQWANYTNQILNTPSPVNVAVDVNVNYSTRTLTILVEVYYTANATNPKNYLNVAILQDEIQSPQAGASSNPSWMGPDGLYYQKHVLRTLLTGQWGVKIPQTTAGTFWDTVIVYQVPQQYGNILAEVANLEVVAFVSESKKEILSGHGKKVPLPPYDLQAFSISGLSSLSCNNTVSSNVTVKNVGLQNVNFFDIEYGFQNIISDTIHVVQAISPGNQATISLPSISSQEEGYLKYFVRVMNPNGNVDYRSSNDQFFKAINLFPFSISVPYTQDFSSSKFPPDHMGMLDVYVDGRTWMRKDANGGSAFINFYFAPGGFIDDLYVGPLNFTGISHPGLSFKIAHVQYNSNYVDLLQVDVSTNCGQSWTNVWKKQDPDLATVSNYLTSQYLNPNPEDWRIERVGLSQWANMNNVMLRFRAISGYGNNLFLDDIIIGEGANLEEKLNPSFLLFPNPSDDYILLQSNLSITPSVMIVICSHDGKEIYRTTEAFEANSRMKINTSMFENGVYVLQIADKDNFLISLPFIVLHR
ncbi:MAG: Omp28-related outer membrane protein [Bacteroidales bacterium]|nr:Omp28-related outer membrane protein [Bacteroidales bacterium]